MIQVFILSSLKNIRQFWEIELAMDSIAGTYNGVLPPNVETTLTLNADGTYLLIQSYNEK